MRSSVKRCGLLVFAAILVMACTGLAGAAVDRPAVTAAAEHVVICHSLGNGGWVRIAPSVDGVLSAHAHHPRDIIPPFEYKLSNGTTGHFPGLNWGAEGRAIWGNGCVPRRPVSEADLATAQTETVAPSAGGGDIVDDQIVIENRGPADATDVELRLIVPAGAAIESVRTDQGSCSVGSTAITCVVPLLDAGGAVDVNVVFHEPSADAAAGSKDDAIVTAAQLDPTPANNSSQASAPAPEPTGATPSTADVAVATQESSATVPLGEPLTETITITNDGPATATGVEITDVLGAAAEVIAVKPGSASCRSEAPLECSLDALPAGSSQTIELSLRPLRPGRLIDTATVSADQVDPNLANNLAKTAATVKRRATSARLRIVPSQPVAKTGQEVGLVVIAAVRKPTPGVAPMVCVTFPPGLRVTSAPGDASLIGARVCWGLTDLVSGRPRSFRLRVRVGPAPRSGATLAVRGRLTGENFAAARASAAVQVTPRLVACPSSARPVPLGRIAC